MRISPNIHLNPFLLLNSPGITEIIIGPLNKRIVKAILSYAITKMLPAWSCASLRQGKKRWEGKLKAISIRACKRIFTKSLNCFRKEKLTRGERQIESFCIIIKTITTSVRKFPSPKRTTQILKRIIATITEKKYIPNTIISTMVQWGLAITNVPPIGLLTLQITNLWTIKKAIRKLWILTLSFLRAYPLKKKRSMKKLRNSPSERKKNHIKNN